MSASAKITLKLKPDARGEKKDSIVRSRLDRDDSVPSMPGHTVMKDDQCPLYPAIKVRVVEGRLYFFLKT